MRAGRPGRLARAAHALAAGAAHRRRLRAGQQWRRRLRAGAACARSPGARSWSCICPGRRRAANWRGAPRRTTSPSAARSSCSKARCRRPTWWSMRCSASACRANPMRHTQALIEAINAQAAPVLALDVPSGIDADRGCVIGAAVVATRTIEFMAGKAGLRTGAALDHVGALSLATLDMPADCFDGMRVARATARRRSHCRAGWRRGVATATRAATAACCASAANSAAVARSCCARRRRCAAVPDWSRSPRAPQHVAAAAGAPARSDGARRRTMRASLQPALDRADVDRAGAGARAAANGGAACTSVRSPAASHCCSMPMR